MDEVDTVTSLMKAYYEIESLPEKEKKLYYLIDRYQHKVSYRLLAKKKDLREFAKICFKHELQNIVYNRNPFLDLVKKQVYENFYPIPIILGVPKK